MDIGIVGAIISVGALGLLFGAGLAIASKVFYVYVDPRVEEVDDALPGANCGACGEAGCRQMALKIVEGELQASDCPVASGEARGMIAEIMGSDAGEVEEKVAVVRCQGSPDNCETRFEYQGVQSCAAAALVGGGFKACNYGCLGLADCVESCPFDAMYMGDDQLPRVIDDLCTGCGNCVEACPRGIMDLIPRKANVYVACVNNDKLKDVKQVCKVGCTTCGMCAKEKVTPSGMIQMDPKTNLPVFNYAIEDDPFPAAHRCPTDSIVDKLQRPKPEKPKKKDKPKPKPVTKNDADQTKISVKGEIVKDKAKE